MKTVGWSAQRERETAVSDRPILADLKPVAGGILKLEPDLADENPFFLLEFDLALAELPLKRTEVRNVDADHPNIFPFDRRFQNIKAEPEIVSFVSDVTLSGAFSLKTE